jgi:hypothetical protein
MWTSTHVQDPLGGTFLLHGLIALSGVTTSPPTTPMVIPRSHGSLGTKIWTPPHLVALIAHWD